MATSLTALPFCFPFTAGARIQTLIDELDKMFPSLNAADLQDDFLEYRNTLRRKCTLPTCCSCGENRSLDDMELDP